MNLLGPVNSGAAVGGDGVATSNADSTSPISGRILAVYIKYNDSPPAGTTDVVISTKGTSPRPPSNTILTLTDAATAGWFYPRHIVHDEVGAAYKWDGTNEVYEPVPVNDIINVAIAQANAGDNVDVWLLFE